MHTIDWLPNMVKLPMILIDIDDNHITRWRVRGTMKKKRVMFDSGRSRDTRKPECRTRDAAKVSLTAREENPQPEYLGRAKMFGQGLNIWGGPEYLSGTPKYLHSSEMRKNL